MGVGRIDAVCGFWFTQEWLSPAESARALRSLRKAVPKFPTTLVPITTDEAGNFTCFDSGESALVDWDHETRKARSLKLSLPGVLAKLEVAIAEATKLARDAKPSRTSRAVAAAPSPAEATSTALPSKLKQLSVPVLRSTDFLGHDAIEDAILSPNGKLAIGRRRGRSTYFIDTTLPKPICPRVPELEASFKANGYLDEPRPESLAADPLEPLFALQSGCNLQLWSWGADRPELVAAARWGIPDAAKSSVQIEGERFAGRLRLAGGWLALAASVATRARRTSTASPCSMRLRSSRSGERARCRARRACRRRRKKSCPSAALPRAKLVSPHLPSRRTAS